MTVSPGAESPIRIVLVDDAADLRELVRLALESSGAFAVVGEGGSGREGVALAEGERPEVVLLDVSMPDMDGLEAIPHIAHVSPESRIVLFSGFEASGLEERARELGAVDFIEKSVPITELAPRLRAAAGVAAPEAGAGQLEGDGIQAELLDAVLGQQIERFRAAFEGASIGMAALTLTGRVVRVNATLAEILGATEADFIGVDFADLVAESARERVAAALHAAARERRAVSIEHGLSRRPSETVVRSIVSAVRDAEERALYLFLQVVDITPELETSRRLFATEQRFRLLVESVSDYAIFMLDTTGQVATWNIGAQKLKGYKAEEIIGQHFRVFYTADAQARKHPEYELEIAKRDGRYEEEGWRIRKDGSRFWANVVITALYNETGELVGFGKVTRDNTDRHAVAEERERVARTLAEANERLRKVADEKAEFVAITAHELRGPVLLMRGSAETLLDDWDRLDEPTRKRLLEMLAAGGNRLHRLLEDLLVVTRAEAGRLDLNVEQLQLQPVLQEAVHEVDPRAAIEVNCDDALTVSADRGRLLQIVTNLVANALKYGAPPVQVTAVAVGDTVEISVTDRGPGVPQSDVPKLFTKFATVRRSSKGTGLGLYIVSQLAQAQDGSVAYRQLDEGGACFTVRLPAAPAAPEVAGGPQRRRVGDGAAGNDDA